MDYSRGSVTYVLLGLVLAAVVYNIYTLRAQVSAVETYIAKQGVDKPEKRVRFAEEDEYPDPPENTPPEEQRDRPETTQMAA